MANITGSDPFGELPSLSPFLADDFFRGFLLRPFFKCFTGEAQMPLDVTERDKAYLVKAEVPGVKKEDISVSIDGNQVSISAEVKKIKEENEGKGVICSERYYGTIYRGFSLDQDIDQEGSNAKYENGTLELTLPKKPGRGTRQLSIS